jgi:hypothetical protein
MASKLPAQALPPDKRPKEPPPAFESMMPSGLTVKWRMPDFIQLVAFDGMIPDPFTAATIDLLKNEKSYADEKDPLRHKNEAANIRGMLGLTAAMWESPRFDPRVEYGEGDTLGRREVGYQDHVAMFQLCRFGSRNPSLPSPSPNELERTQDTPSDSDGIRADASAAVGD